MALQAIPDSKDDIPEAYQDLYTQKGEKWELTGIVGIKTQADVDRVQTALQKERDERKAANEKAAVWDGMDHEEVMAKLDRIPELEAAAKGKLDETQIEEMVTRRVDGTLASRTAPLERQIKQLTEARDEALGQVTALTAEKNKRIVHDAVREALVESKVLPEAHEDALMLAERVFEIREDDGAVVTRDNVGVTPGSDAKLWLVELADKRPHWWAASQGGGARGGGGGGRGGVNNPWSAEHWNLTDQSNYVRQHGIDKATKMAQQAGSAIGAIEPPARKSAA